MNRETYLNSRIEMIEEELHQLKRVMTGGKGHNISLLGVWEGLDIPDELIEEAKRSLVKGAELDE